MVLLSLDSVLNSKVFGYIGAVIAILFFGSNYVVTKKFPIGDGLAFQWFMAIGILVCGYIVQFIASTPPFVFDYYGIIGGGLWAVGNAMVPTIINLVGLGLGLLLWTAGNLLIGYFVGRFGILGVPKTDVNYEYLNYIGIAIGFISLIPFFFVKPDISGKSEKYQEEKLPILGSTNGEVIDELERSKEEEKKNLLEIVL